MRCKVGDLAVYVGADPDCLGHITRIVAPWPLAFDEPAWWIEPAMPKANGSNPHGCVDRLLRPIRDNDGTDETLTWKELPSPVEIIKEITHG